MQPLTSRRLLRGLASNYATVAIGAASIIVLTRVLFRELGSQQYAVYALAFAAAATLEMLAVAPAEALLRYLSEHRAQQQTEETRRLASTMFWVMLGLGAAVTGVFLSGGRWVILLFAGPEMRSLALPAILIMSAGTVFQFGSAALRSYLVAFEEFVLVGAVDVSYLLLTFIGTLFAVYRFGSVNYVAVMLPVAAVVRLLGYFLATRQADLPFVPRTADFERGLLRRLRVFSALAFFEDNTRRLFLQADVFIAARLLPVADVALLSVARRLPYALSNLPQYALVVAYPRLVAAYVRGEEQNTRAFVAISMRNVLALLLPVVTVMCLWPDVLLLAWIGPDAVAAAPVLQLLALCGLLRAVYDVGISMAYGTANLKLSALLMVGMLVAVVGAGTLWSQRGGLVGLATVVLAVQLAGTALMLLQALRTTRTGVFYWLRAAIVPLLPALALNVLWLLVSRRFLVTSFGSLVLAAAVGWLLFAVPFILMANGLQRRTLRASVRVLLVGHE